MGETELYIYLILFLAAFVAGFIDSIAGGGGLIATPALLLAGLPPLNALATNKLQAVFGSSTAAINYNRKIEKSSKEQKLTLLFVVSFIGSVLGTIIISSIDASVLINLIPILLIGVALFFALKKDIEKIHRNTILTFNTFILITLLIGGYDGAIGPGTGSFFMLAFVSLRGMTLLNATYNTKVVNFASNLGSLITFIYLDLVNWSIGFVMAAGQMITGGIGGQLANFGNVLGKALKDPFSAQAQQSVVDSAVDIANNLNSTAVPYALGAVSDLALGALNQAGKAAGIGDIRGGYDKLSNRQMNQFLEAMFTGIGFRKFSYMFKFAPKSVEEAQEVDAIIRMFKFHMLPEIPMNDFGRYFRTPSDFDIHYMFRGEENTFLNKLATCVCLNVDVNYTPNGYQTMRPMRGRPGAPMSQIDMKLDFMETELITKEKILEGF